MSITFVFLSFTALSCSYENTVVDLNSLWKSTWNFNQSSNYEFDEKYIEVVDGKASLRVLYLEHGGDDFDSGNHVGTHSFNQIGLKTKPSQLLGVNEILPSRESNLVGYWLFDSDFFDKSSLATVSGIVGDVSISDSSKVGNGSAIFDGDLDGITLIDYDVFTSEQTGAMWVNLNEVTSQQMLFAQNNTVEFQLQMQGDGNNSLVRMRIDLDSGYYLVDSISSISPETWNHIAWTYDGSNLRIFINGILENSTLASGVFLDNDSVSTIGAWSLSTQYSTNGKIDEVSLWTAALSEDEIFKLYESQSLNYIELSSSWTPKWDNIVGYWKMDGNWQDSSGNGNHGVASGGIGFESNSIIGSSNGIFDGVSGEVNISNNYNINKLTVSAWAKAHSLTTGAGVVSTDSAPGFLQIGGAHNPWQFNCTTDIETIKLDQWYHLVGSSDGIMSRLYVNGRLIEEDTCTHTWATLSIGKRQAGNLYFDGEVDDFAIWDNQLSQSEVSLIYNRQKQKYAGHYDSEVIDLGSTTSTWPDLSWSTSLPFGKELVGDFDNDGNPDSESSSDYSLLSDDLSNGLVGYWSFNELTWDGTLNEVKDYSGNTNHGTSNVGANSILAGKLNKAGQFNGTSGNLEVFDSPSIEANNQFSVFSWIKNEDLSMGSLRVIISKYDFSSNNREWRLYRNTNGDLGVAFSQDGLNTGAWHSNDPILLNETEWLHVGFIFSSGVVRLFLNGKEITGSAIGTIPNSIFNGLAPLTIGSNMNSNFWQGNIDEAAIWNRILSESEIQAIYRRGANRVKLQVKSCVDSSCICESFNTAPVGSATDCDGDGIINTLDSDDTYKSKFIGPGGDGTTYYSELYNRETTEVTFDCALNITDSDAGVCAADEVTLSAGPKPTGPEFLNSDYTQFIKPPANQFIQYRVYMEADDNTACNGEPCLPELSSVNLNPSNITKYSGGPAEIKPTNSITYKVINGVTVDADLCATYQLSNDGTNYYYWDGTIWASVATIVDQTTKLDFENHITDFATQFGPGKLFIKSFLQSDSGQTSNCTINDINVDYSN